MRTVFNSSRWLLPLLVLVLAITGNTQLARAQGHTPDPYNIVGEYNSQYEPYLYATEPTEDGTLPNQNVRTSRPPGSRASSESINGLDDLEGNTLEPAEPSSTRRRAGAGTPYYRAALDEDRTGRTNQATDDSYFANQRKRSEEYFKAMSEKDPKKRARLLRELNLENIRVSRMLPNFKTSASNKRGERLKFDTPSDELEDANRPGRTRDDATEEDSTARKAPSPETVKASAARNRTGSTSKTKRSSSASPARGASRTQTPARDSGLSVDSILERSERFDLNTEAAAEKPSRSPARRPQSGKP